MKSIQTAYKGYNFRSRLEARWAVFFDALGLRWEYEGFELPGGARYLPDFLLPTFSGGLWAEVKPFGSTDIEKPKALARLTGRDTLFLDGPPDHRAWRCFSGEESCEFLDEMAAFVPKYLPGGVNGEENRLYHEHYEDWAADGHANGLPSHLAPDYNGSGKSTLVIRAIVAARFEYGQSGATL